MGTKRIETLMESSYIIRYCEVELKKNTYIINAKIEAPRDNVDLGEIVKLQNKIRKGINQGFSLQFNLQFTI